MRRLSPLLALLLLSLSACTFVKMAPGAREVRVLSAAPAGCVSRGELVVSITHKVGPYERNDLRVRDELELLARNEAPSLQANSISPMGAPEDGSQRWARWRCP